MINIETSRKNFITFLLLLTTWRFQRRLSAQSAYRSELAATAQWISGVAG